MEAHYKLVAAEEVDCLEGKVNHWIGKGYLPIGAIAIKGCKLIQPMTFNINPETNVNAKVQNNY